MAAQSLGELLGTVDPRPEPTEPREEYAQLADLSAREFCQRILESIEFRQYIMNGLTLGDIAPAIVTKLMDYAWGKPVERVEHTGKDGKPIETIAEVRRVIVHARPQLEEQDEDDAAPARPITH